MDATILLLNIRIMQKLLCTLVHFVCSVYMCTRIVAAALVQTYFLSLVIGSIPQLDLYSVTSFPCNFWKSYCRPVKVVRLVTRHSVEEIVLKRATVKLKMTSSVIEGGQVRVDCDVVSDMTELSSPSQFTHGTVTSVAENTSQLSEILKFGLDTLLQSDER